tara:strand:- start:1241 stop:1585 length:345 start_codon:yes stop_codon:yes gene_type:complete
MKKKEIEHPKLYFDYLDSNNKVKLLFYSNKIDNNGNRISENKEIEKSKLPSDDILQYLNKIEYDKLLRYILRQEKVMDVYHSKGFTEQYNIVKESLKLMYEFKNHFETIYSNES